MKKNLALLAITACVYFQTSGQSNLTYKIALGSSNSIHSNITVLMDSNLLLSGHDPSQQNTFFVSKINKDGNLKWSKTYSIGTNNVTYALESTADNGFITITGANVLAPTACVILKCDSLGQIEWKTQLISTKYGNINGLAISQTSDGSYFICAGIKGHIFLIKVNTAGAIIWNKNYEITTSDIGYFIDAVSETPDGGGIFSINNIGFGCEGESECEYNELIKFNDTGEFTRHFSVSVPGLNNLQVQLIKVENETTHLLYRGTGKTGSGYFDVTYDPNNGKSKALMLPGGIFTLQAYYKSHSFDYIRGTTFPKRSIAHIQYAITKDWKIIQVSSPGIIHVDQYDSEGKICPDFGKPIVNNSTFSRIVNVTPLSYGILEDTIKQITVNVSTNTINNVSISCQNSSNIISNNSPDNLSSIKESQIKTNIYPNPVSNTFDIRIISKVSTTAKVSIISSDGKMIKDNDRALGVGETIVKTDMSSFANGVYFIKVVTATGETAVHRFIKN